MTSEARTRGAAMKEHELAARPEVQQQSAMQSPRHGQRAARKLVDDVRVVTWASEEAAQAFEGRTVGREKLELAVGVDIDRSRRPFAQARDKAVQALDVHPRERTDRG